MRSLAVGERVQKSTAVLLYFARNDAGVGVDCMLLI